MLLSLSSTKFSAVKISNLIKFILLVVIIEQISAQPQSGSQVYDYRIDFLFIPCVNLTMKIIPYERYEGRTVTRLEFITDTNKFFSQIYEVHNSYVSLYDPKDFTIIFNEKFVIQPNLKQQVSATYTDTIVQYSNQKSINIPTNTHNLFSLIMHCRELSIKDLEEELYFVESEGHLYEATFSYLGEEVLVVENKGVLTEKIEINLFPLNPERDSFLNSTDVFNWKIMSSEAKRLLWLERENPHRIIKCKFYLSPVWVTARLVE